MGNGSNYTNKVVYYILISVFILPLVVFSRTIYATDCKNNLVVFARGSGQNKTGLNTNEPLNEKDFGSKEAQSYKFFYELNKRIDGTKEFISLHNMAGFNQYGYEATDALDVLKKPIHRTDVASRYLESVANGKEELVGFLKQRIAECPTQKIILGGYSQGAQVVGEALWGLSPTERARINYAALFGDPKFNPYMGGLNINRGPWVRGDSNRLSMGILGARKFYLPADVINKGSWCDKSDPICTGSNIKGSGVFVLAFDQIDQTHTVAYQATDGWIVQASNEIALNAGVGQTRVNPATAGLYINKNNPTGKLDIALVIDSSGTMGNELATLKLSAKNFIANLFAESWDTRVGVVAYSDNDYPIDPWRSYWLAQVNQDFTTDQNAIYNAIHLIVPYGMANNNSAMYSGLMKSFNDLNWRYGAQKKVITITNNSARTIDPGGYTSADVIKKALELDPVAVSAVNLKNINTNNNPATNSLNAIATATNGTVITGSFGTTSAINSQVNLINTAPVAIIAGPSDGYAVNGLELTAGSSYDPDSYITTYKWDCNNDGVWDFTESQPGINCSYTNSYSGLVVLEVSSADSQSAKAILDVNISGGGLLNTISYTTPNADITNRTADTAEIKINNTYPAGTLIALSDAEANIFNYFDPEEPFVLNNLGTEASDIYLTAGLNGIWSEPSKLTIPKFSEAITPIKAKEQKTNTSITSSEQTVAQINNGEFGLVNPQSPSFYTTTAFNSVTQNQVTNIAGISSSVEKNSATVESSNNLDKLKIVAMVVGTGILITSFLGLVLKLLLVFGFF